MLNKDLVLSYSSLVELKNHLISAEQELTDLLTRLGTIGDLNQLSVSPITNQLVSFRQRYQDRLIAASIGDREELKEKLQEELATMLGDLILLDDYLFLHNPTKLTEQDLTQAKKELEQRTQNLADLNLTNSLAQNIEYTKSSFEGKVESEHWVPLQDLKNRSVDDLVRIITRAISVDLNLDNDITGILMSLVRGINQESMIQRLFDQYQLPFDLNIVMRDLAESQALRDAIAAPFAPLLKKLIKKETIVIYDEDFRATYLAIYNFVRAVYLSNLAGHHEWKKKTPTPVIPSPPLPPTSPQTPIVTLKTEDVTPIQPLDIK